MEKFKGAIKNIQRLVVKFVIHILVLIVYRVKIVGKKNIPTTGSALLCPNHVHAFDSVCIVATLKRPVRALAKESLYRYRFLKWLAKIFGIYPVNQKNSAISAIKIAFKLLKEEELVLIFPEGTRNGMKKGVKPKDGAVNIAIKADVPIIPIGVQGSFKVFRKVKINIGKPLYYNKNEIDDKDKIYIEHLTGELMDEIIRLANEKI